MNSMEKFNVLKLGLFEKRIEGDDCLLALARQRFAEAAMGAEMHAATPEQLQHMMNFRPAKETPVIVHLPRDVHLGDERGQRRVLDMATRFAGQISGLVVHDHAALAERRSDYVDAAWRMDDQLGKIRGGPMLFVEYAVGLARMEYARFFSAIPDLDRISACIDIGHVGIHAAQAAFARLHGGEDICALKTQGTRLRQVITDVEAAVESGFAAVLELVDVISAVKKPVHFHLHDAHPLSAISPFGVSDHLSFLTEIPLSFEHRGLRTVAPMFGPAGLSRLVARALELLGPPRASFTLEIHPTPDRLPLGDASPLFRHWTDKTNAEQMNHWLWVLSRNHSLLREAVQSVMPPGVNPPAGGLHAQPCLN